MEAITGADLKEIESRLLEVEARLVDAAGRAAIAGRIRAKLEEQIQTVKQMLAAIEAHAAPSASAEVAVDVSLTVPSPRSDC